MGHLGSAPRTRRVVRADTRRWERRLPTILGTRSRAPCGCALALPAVPIIWWILYRSTLGFEIRTVGANPDAARYAACGHACWSSLTMTVGGLLAGLAGAIEILGVQGYMPAAYATTVGFDAITVALARPGQPDRHLLRGPAARGAPGGAPLM